MQRIKNAPNNQNHKETTIHGNYEFPIAVYINQPDRYRLHWHDEIQFSLVTKGKVEFLVNKSSFMLTEGQGIFINSGHLHLARSVTESDSAYICIDADPKIISFFQGSIIEQKYLNPFLKHPEFSAVTFDYETAWENEIIMKIREIYDLYSQKPFGYEFNICMTLASMWIQLVGRHSEVVMKNRSHDDYIGQYRIKTIISYIHDNYSEKTSLQEIAPLINMSKGECCRIFKRIVRCTIFDYIMAYRINKSIELLLTADLTISQIADRVGFGTTSYYIQRFKKHVSCTPKEYQKRFRQC